MNHERQAGVSLLEVVIASSLTMVVIMGVYGLFHTGVDAYGVGSVSAEVQRRSTQVLDLISEEIGQTGRDVIYPQVVPPKSTSRITLQRNAGFSEGEVHWSPVTVIEFRHCGDDPDDGKDNNGNGLVDEGFIVRIDNAGSSDERLTVLARNVREYLEGEIPNGQDDNGNGLVDEAGLSFDVIGEVWTIRLTMERTDDKGRRVMHTAQTSIKTRN